MSIPQPRAFIELRERLFNDLGVSFPDIEVRTDSTVPEQAAVVRLNDVRHAPRPLPDEGAWQIAAVLGDGCGRTIMVRLAGRGADYRR
jgi:type III secretory pathway component EscV